MAADADHPAGELSDTTVIAASPAPLSQTSEEPGASPEESELAVAAEADAEEAEDYNAEIDDEVNAGAADGAPVSRRMSHVRLATMVGVVVVVALAALTGWLGFRAYQSHQAQAQRQLFVQVARQGALNLTTIDWQHADADVQRLLDSATGKFYDQFSPRKQPFIDVVKKAQSKSVGTITEAGLASESGDEAQVLVVASIKISNLGAADQPLRDWRMQITVQKSGDEVKVSNVAFVP